MEGVVAEKTAEELKREIDELHRRHQEINERLRNPRGLRKASSFGPNARNAGMGGLRQMGPQRGVIRRPDDEDQPPAKKRLLSTVVKVDDELSVKVAAEKLDEQAGQAVVEKVDEKGSMSDKGEEGEVNGKPNAQVVSRRDNRRGSGGFQELGLIPVEPLPRVLMREDNPNLAKRNRRMFGALLGTLERFKQEDKQLSASEAFARRSDSLKRAEQKAQEESERLRQQEREQLAERRRTDLTLRARIAAKTEEKQLELLFIQWAEHYSKLSKFLRTKTEPHIFFVPAKPTDELEKALENQQKNFVEWQTIRREELTKYQKGEMERHLTEAEAEFERWASRRNAPNNKGIGNSADKEGGKTGSDEAPKLKARVSQEEEDIEEDLVDLADVDFAGNALEEEDEGHEPKDCGPDDDDAAIDR